MDYSQHIPSLSETAEVGNVTFLLYYAQNINTLFVSKHLHVFPNQNIYHNESQRMSTEQMDINF